MSATIARLCVDDVIASVQSISQFKNKVFQVYSEDELFDRSKNLIFPCVGVVYGGMRASPESKATHKVGMSAELAVSILVLFKNDVTAKKNQKMDTVDVLDELRDALKDRRSPSGHFWKFQVEAAATANGGVLVYLQRWATPVQLT